MLVIPLSGRRRSSAASRCRTPTSTTCSAPRSQRDKTTQVVLKADKGVAHGRVVNLMERAKEAGLTRLAIGTAGGK